MTAKMDHIANKAKEILLPMNINFLEIQAKDGLCSSVGIHGSFDKKEDWSNNIFHNSRYFIFNISPSERYYIPGVKVSVEMLSNGGRWKFRKYTGTPEAVIEKIRIFLLTTQKSLVQ